MLTILKQQAWLVASLVVMTGISSLGGNALAAEQPNPSVELMFAALGQSEWNAADLIAAELDAKAKDKSLFSNFSRATRFVASGDCASGGPLAENVVKRSPLFLPAYDLIAKCMVEAGEPEKAAAMFDNVASRLDKSAERDQIEARAQSLRPDMSAKLSVDANVQPSTNANRGTDNTNAGIFTIDQSARTKAGFLASAFGTMKKPVYISKRLISSVSLRAGLSYDTVSETFFSSARLALNTRYMLSPQSSFGVVSAYDQVFKGFAFESASPSLALDFSHQSSPALTLGARVELAYTHHNNPAQTGWSAKFNTNASYTILPNDRLSVAAFYVREMRKAKNYSFDQIGGAIEWEHAFESGFIGSLGGEASYLVYKSDAPLTTERQNNIQAKTTIGVSHRSFMIGKFRPELAYTFTKQWSNDVFSNFDAHDVSVRAKAAF